MEQIIAQKLKIYTFLRDKITDFKGHLRAEEEAHNMTIAKGFGKKKWGYMLYEWVNSIV